MVEWIAGRRDCGHVTVISEQREVLLELVGSMGKFWKIFGYGVLGLVGLAVVGFVVMGSYFPLFVYGALTLLTRDYDMQPSFFARFRAEIEVNGFPVTFDRILECRSIKMGGSMGVQDMKMFKKISTPRATTVGATGARLPDGSALMMWIPYYCGTEVVADEEGHKTLVPKNIPPTTIPFMAWAPNADTLETMEIYLTKKYFSETYARIKVKRIEVLEAPNAKQATPPDEFEWFTGEKVKGVELKTAKEYRFRGLMAVVAQVDTFPEKLLRLEKTTKFLESQEKSSMIRRKDLGISGISFSKHMRISPTTTRRFSYYSPALELGISPFPAQVDQSHDFLIPLIRSQDGKKLNILWDRRGYIIVRKLQKVRTWYKNLFEMYESPIKTFNGPDGTIYNIDNNIFGNFFYIKEDNALIYFGTCGFSFPDETKRFC